MPVAVSYPGVYVEEIPSGVHTITGVATSIAAFVDFFQQGPTDKAVELLSFADFQRQFGGLNAKSQASYAIQQFFLNGGSTAYAVRVSTAGASAAAISLNEAGKSAVLTATAKSSGEWGKKLRVDVDYDTSDPQNTFNLVVSQVTTVNGKTKVAASEAYRELVIDASKPNDAAKTVTALSQFIKLDTVGTSTGKRPAPTGTTSAYLDLTGLGLKEKDDLQVLVGNSSTKAAAQGSPLALTKDNIPTDPVGLAALLSGFIGSVLPKASVYLAGAGNSRYLVAEVDNEDATTFINFTGKIADALKWSDANAANVQHYCLGAPADFLAASGHVDGSDGTWDPSGAGAAAAAAALIGIEAKKTGMYQLLDTDIFNILCLPVVSKMADPSAGAVSAAAIKLCQDRRAMYLLDGPEGVDSAGIDGIQTWLGGQSSLRSANSALYFPGVQIPDPLDGFNLKRVAASGTVAGLYARTDANRGVWKAPAGTEASLSGVQQLPYKLTDPENGVLNPLAINCLRVFPVYGPVCWGARTLVGADQMADDYKYVPVRRLALFIEESLFRGTKWVVFEPNDEPLWAQVRLNVGAFMQNLFRQGAFAGKTPQEAYFVKCDSTNNPQNTVNLGIINVAVGFAPLKPAEFVVIQIQQIAGDIAS
ncbi:MAG: phage tail sheath subtilisin-like domain-containing protein [Alphaproteobacteria bacterium]|nr:phage tail sheath subtilisin-like domain-containing protein [Alphaproteobacteria bacterium]